MLPKFRIRFKKENKIRLTIVLICCIFSFGTASQTKTIDSLKKAQLTTKDSAKADLLNNISKQYWMTDFDSSILYARLALTLSESIGYRYGLAEAYRSMGMANNFNGVKKSSQEFLLKALSGFRSLQHTRGMAATFNNLGLLLANAADYAASLKYLDSALIFFRLLNDKEGEGSVLNYIGITYQRMGNYNKAIDYCLQGFEIRKSINDHPGVVFSLINTGNMYLDVGQTETGLKFYEQSISYALQHKIEPYGFSLNQAGKAFLNLKKYDSAENYLLDKHKWKKTHYSDPLLLGRLYFETNRRDQAELYFRQSLMYAEEGKDKIVIAESKIWLSKLLTLKGDHNAAMKYAMESSQLADSIKSLLVSADAYELLAQLYESRGDYFFANQYFKRSHAILDSLNSENYQKKLAFADTKNEIEKEQAKGRILTMEKSLQEEKLKKEKLTKAIIIGVFSFAILLSLFIIRNINIRRKKIQIQKDLAEIQTAELEKAYGELKSTQAQLVQKEKMASLGELTAGIAHEIQNPLNFINNFSEVNQELVSELKDEISKGNISELGLIADNIKENESKINFHGKRADGIVKGMLQHSRSSKGPKELTEINALAEEYLRMSYHGIADDSYHLNLRTDLDHSIEKLSVIPQDIGRVFLNLYNNAFYSVIEKKKISPDDYEPTVSLITKSWADRIEISVKDNGMGIPEKFKDKIFQPFFTTKPTGQGTGLGLSLAYDIVKAHVGEIRVINTPGEGAEFIITLPIKP